MEHNKRMYEAAAAYGRAGWRVFPLGHFSKKPAIKKGFLGASQEEFQIAAWWKAKSYAGGNIGWAIPEGILIIDVDVREEKNGEAEFHKLLETLGPLPATRQVTTASGGWHLYFRVPAGFLARKELVPGSIDLKGPGGYVLLPPSALVVPRADGAKAKAEYTWDGLKGFEEPIAELPAAWLAACRRAPVTGPAGGGEYTAAALEPITLGCAWIRHCKTDAARLPEPEWYGLLGILGRCEGGRELAHAWSKPYKGYSPAETEKKLGHALTAAGPVTCLHVEHDLGGASYCEACPHHGKLTSPIVLGSSAAPVASEPWAAGLLLNQKGRVVPCLANAVLALGEHPDWKERVAYNAFTDTVEFQAGGPAGAGPLTDEKQLKTVVWLQTKLAAGVNEHITRSALELTARGRPVHPVRVEQERARKVWDEQPRLREGFFQTYFGVESSQAKREGHQEEHELYLDHVAVFFLVSLMARLYRPGARIEHVLVLEGGEAAAKSHALALLARWPYAAHLHPKLESPAAVEGLRGAWVVEVQEPSLYEPAVLREFLFRTHDRQRTEFWRPAYGRLWQAVPRQCVFAVTGECTEELFGWRGMPVECGPIDVAALARDAEQVRAEALYLLQEQAARWWPGRAIRPLFQREQGGRKVQDPLTMRIERYIETHGHISVLEMLDAFNIPAAQQSAALGRRAARILAARGYHRAEEREGIYWVDPGRSTIHAGPVQ